MWLRVPSHEWVFIFHSFDPQNHGNRDVCGWVQTMNCPVLFVVVVMPDKTGRGMDGDAVPIWDINWDLHNIEESLDSFIGIGRFWVYNYTD